MKCRGVKKSVFEGSSNIGIKQNETKRSWTIKQVFVAWAGGRTVRPRRCLMSYLLTPLTEPLTNWGGNYMIVCSQLRHMTRV